jgi:nitrous oxidase accessory protein NosD
MAISRGQLVKELEPGLNALFGLEYKRYENQHAEIYTTESSDRAFEEEVMLSGFAQAQTKSEGSGVTFDNAQETYTARYTHETVALAFSITEEAIEDNLYDRLASRYTKALARSMANTKQVKAVAPLINGLPTNDAFDSGDGVSLFNTAHPTIAGTVANTL